MVFRARSRRVLQVLARASGRALRRSGLAVVTSLLVAGGCTQLLGIDGNYVLGLGGSASTGDASVATGGRDVGSGGTGGTTASGGRSASGGSTPALHDASAADSGGTGCRPGHYQGSFEGFHRSLVTFVGYPVTVDSSSLSFDLTGSGRSLAVSAGAFTGHLTSIPVPDAGSFDMELTGQFDCASGKIVNGKMSGRVTVLRVPSPCGGTWEASLDPSEAFTGVWMEEEDIADAGSHPSVCVPGEPLSAPNGTGCGMLTATRQ